MCCHRSWPACRHWVPDPTETVMVRVGDTERELPGCGDPQTMRMLLLQILTGRRVSEICMCEFDCLSPPTARAVQAAEGEQVARFHYAQTCAASNNPTRFRPPCRR